MVAALDTTHDSGATHGLAKFSVLHGCVGLTVEFLKDLVNLLGVKVKRLPTNEKGLFTVVVRHFFADADQARIDTLWNRRGAKERKRIDPAMLEKMSENFENIDGVLHEKDAEEIQKVVVAARTALHTKLAAARASLAGAMTADRGSNIDIEYARTFIPPYCTLDKEASLFWRWNGHMPKKPKAPRTITKTWSKKEAANGVSEREALIAVLNDL